MSDTLPSERSRQPSAPPEVLESYDPFFLKQLRVAMRIDYERFGGGKFPSYRNHIADVVHRRGHGVIPISKAFSYQNLRNFLRGVSPQPYIVKLLDVYMQIVQRDIRPRFFEDKYTQVLGDHFAEYLGDSTGNSTAVADALCGCYINLSQFDHWFASQPLPRHPIPTSGTYRHLCVRRFSSSNYLIYHEFNAEMDSRKDHNIPRDLVSGFLIPNELYSVLLARSYRPRRHRAGLVYYKKNLHRDIISGLAVRAQDYFKVSEKTKAVLDLIERTSYGLDAATQLEDIPYDKLSSEEKKEYVMRHGSHFTRQAYKRIQQEQYITNIIDSFGKVI